MSNDGKLPTLRRLGLWIAREAAGLWAAAKASSEAIALALLLAAICFRVSEQTALSHSLVSRVAEHTGIAFFVAAIAVFGYEWKSHSKDLLTVARDLKDVLRAQHMEGAARCITGMFEGEDTFRVTLRSNLINVLSASYDVVSEKVWNRDLAVGMIGALLACAVKSANKFADTKLNKESGFTIEFPRPAELLDQMLATQMGKISPDGKYVVISDFMSFQGDQLATSIKAMRFSVKDGAKVKRLFFCFKHDQSLSLAEVERIARMHWNLACELAGGYEVGFAKLQDGGAEPPHEGVFTSKDGSVGFTVKDPDLHKIRFFSVPEGADPANFIELWAESLVASADPAARVEFGKYLSALTAQRSRQMQRPAEAQ